MARLAAQFKGVRVPVTKSGAEIRGLAGEFLSGWLGLTLFLATAALSLYLVQVSSMATAGYELQRLEAERDGWRARNEQLDYELAKRRSLAWVETQARERLGLVRPDRPAPVIPVTPVAAASSGRGGGRPPTAAGPDTSAPNQARVGSAARPSPGDPSVVVDLLRLWATSAAGVVSSRSGGG